MKCLLTSSGLSNSALMSAVKNLTEKPNNDTSVLFITTAANTGFDDKRWLIENLRQFDNAQFKSVDILDIAGLPKEVWKPHFDHADVLCVGGGDEQYLAHILRNEEIRSELLTFMKTKVYIGISAGSMVLGHFLPGYGQALFPEEDFGGYLAEPLKLFNLVFLPHLNSEYFAHMRVEQLEALRERCTLPTYATDDDMGILIDGDLIELVGVGESWTANI